MPYPIKPKFTYIKNVPQQNSVPQHRVLFPPHPLPKHKWTLKNVYPFVLVFFICSCTRNKLLENVLIFFCQSFLGLMSPRPLRKAPAIRDIRCIYTVRIINL